MAKSHSSSNEKKMQNLIMLVDWRKMMVPGKFRENRRVNSILFLTFPTHHRPRKSESKSFQVLDVKTKRPSSGFEIEGFIGSSSLFSGV